MRWRRSFAAILWLSASFMTLCISQRVTFLDLLANGDLGQLTEMATRLAASAAQQTIASNRDALERLGSPEPAPITINARPSEILGQSITNAISPTLSKLIDGTQSLSRSQSSFNSNSNVSPNLKNATSNNAFSTPPNNGNNDQKVSPNLNGYLISGPLSNTQLSITNAPTLLPTVQPNFLPSLDNDNTRESIIQLAEAFLGSPKRPSSSTSNRAFAAKQLNFDGKDADANMDPFPTIRQLAPAARNNFGFPKGEGCLPFLSEFMQIAYGNCVKEADAKTWDLWGGQINNALQGRAVDLLNASKETCKRGVERQQCGQLKRVISECDILGSLQVGMQMQRALQRCEEISGIIDQNPVQVLNQVNGMIGGEVAQGFLHKFLG